MEEITEEAAELVARVVALDVGKASLVECVRVPHKGRPADAGRRSARSSRRPGRCWNCRTGWWPRG
jgi:hypothetical protein